MIKDLFCCPKCFENEYIRNYIIENHEKIGLCPYCNSQSVHLISLKTLSIYMRFCLEKAFDGCDVGTGAMYDSEDKMYLGPDGEEAVIYSIRDILTDKEVVFSDKTIETTLLEDLFENLYSYREIQKGADDRYADVNSPAWVIKNDLYGCEQTKVFHAWENFKFIIKHFNRFFDTSRCSVREDYLERMDPYVYNHIDDLPSGTKFFRARMAKGNLTNLDIIEPYSQMTTVGPDPTVVNILST